MLQHIHRDVENIDFKTATFEKFLCFEGILMQLQACQSTAAEVHEGTGTTKEGQRTTRGAFPRFPGATGRRA